MANIPHDGSPGDRLDASNPEPDNTLEIIGAAFSGILTIVAGIFQSAGHTNASLWLSFAAVIFYVASVGSFLRDRDLLPRLITQYPKFSLGVVLFLCYFPMHYLGREIMRDATESEQWKDDVGSQLGLLDNSVEIARTKISAMQPRRLTKSQKKTLKERLAPFAGQTTCALCPLTDSEAIAFATDFASAFTDAGWVFDGYTGAVAPSEADNVCITVHPETDMVKARDAVIALRNAIVELGLSKNPNLLGHSTSVKKGDICITISGKPLPDEQAAIGPLH